MSQLKHVAIIMDGNGRWAKERHRPRAWGHIRGSKIVSDIVAESSRLGLEALTLYAFSTENWSRPEGEIKTLFKLLRKYLEQEQGNILKNNIRFKVIGDIKGLDESTIKLIKDTEEMSSRHSGLQLSFAFGYGGRKEIVDSVNCYIQENPGKLISESDLAARLYRPEIGDVDLLIRTAGDQRVSNFLLWQICYAEFYFTHTKWPDFSVQEFRQILELTGSRERRFGGLGDDGNLERNQNLARQSLKNFSEESFGHE